MPFAVSQHSTFQSTLSMRRATSTCATCPTTIGVFQSTLSMRRATWWDGERLRVFKFQSTLSMRRATESTDRTACAGVISIHALHEESDSSSSVWNSGEAKFQSTLSMRRATGGPSHGSRSCPFQSTLSMRRATFAPTDPG